MSDNYRVSHASAEVRPSAIHAELRERIIDQLEAPGSTLTESAVALRFRVTRPTAKIAIERLVAEGLLRREPHQAARVPELSRDDVLDLYENRAILESAATAALARGGTIPAEALAAHRSLLDIAREKRPFARADAAFHRGLVAGQPSPRLARMHALLMGEIELGIGQVQAHALVTAATVAEQHQGILDAVTTGDAELARHLARSHVEFARDILLAHYDSTHYDSTHD
jgi:DNA-binding GntR family transcriptional regulator